MTEKKENEAAEKEPAEEKKKEDEYKDLQDRFLRLAAEFDNYKKRTAKDVDNAKLIGKAEFARKLLSTIDEFELAIIAMEDQGEERRGIELIYSNLLDSLKSEGLCVIDSQGVYDPYKHEIVMGKESEKKDNTIIETVRKGYMLNGVLLRPSSVIVSKKKEKQSDE